MNRKCCLIFLLFVLTLPLFSMDLEVNEFPCSIEVSWNEVSNTERYRVFLNSNLIDETDDTRWTFGNYTNALWPDSYYNIEIQAINSSGKVIDRISKKCRTTSWAGTYVWTNPTTKDNKGKCKQLVFEVEKIESFYPNTVVYSIKSEQGIIFPLINSDGIEIWHDWNEDSNIGYIYRSFANVFNTTSFNPDSWCITKMNVGPNYYRVEVHSKIFFLTVTTVTNFIFRYNKETNTNELLFFLSGDGLAKTGIFKNPNPNRESDEVFILTKQ